MKLTYFFSTLLFSINFCIGQQNPAITSWLQNTTTTGTYYVQGNNTPISNNILVNCQQVEYSSDYVYVTATGIPAYTTGPFLDGNPSIAQNQNAIYKFPLNPQQNTGAPSYTTMGNIGVFINGTALFDYRDGVAWNPTTNALCGGPGNPPCPGGFSAVMDWNRDAIPAEMDGFDCSKGHPAMGAYHHHQNPSAFKLDLSVLSSICNLYDADGLYVIDSTQHSPILGFAYDGYPIYGAYGYKNTDGTGGITRIKSSYQLKNMTSRVNGPPVNNTYFLGYFKEDYEYISNNNSDYLDDHNGRFCVTQDYPSGTYAYFCTVDENWNSAYPYAVGPTFYGVYANASVNNISEPTTIYNNISTVSEFNDSQVTVFPNPTSDLIAIQIGSLNTTSYSVKLLDNQGKLIKQKTIHAGSTITYFSTETLYNGAYFIQIYDGINYLNKTILLNR